MLKALKNSEEIKIHLESKNGYYIKGNKIHPFNLAEIDDVEIVNYIIMNGVQTPYEYEIISSYGDIYKYCLDDGGEYEFNNHVYIYSLKYFSSQEFEKMCKEAQKKLEEKYQEGYEVNDIYRIASMLEELYPTDFIQVSLAQVFCPGGDY